MRYLLILIFVAAGTVVHGAVTQRWAVFGPTAGQTERVHGVVVEYADCISTPVEHDVPLMERSIATSRSYVSNARRIGAMTSIISGVPGAVATHTPDVCYTASGYRMLRDPRRETIALPDGASATFLVADFEKKKATQTERVRVRWAWSADGTWTAPEYARFQFMKVPELYKLYVVTPLPEGDAADPAPVAGFVAAAFAQYATVIAR